MKKSRKHVLFGVATMAMLLWFTVPLVSADLQISPWYPQDMSYVFICNSNVSNPTSFDWDFDDGQHLFDMGFDNIYHTFEAPGTYEVACTASNGIDTQVLLLKVTAGTIQDVPPAPVNTTDNTTNITTEINVSTSVEIAPWFPQGEFGQNFVFECNATGFTPTSYDWDFGDGELLHDVSNSNVWHSYTTGGSYAVECTATDGDISQVGEIHINVGGIVETPTNLLNATVTVADWYPQGLNYIFVCNTTAFSAATYTWYFGDGQQLIDITNNDVWHTYDAAGNYTVECDAKDTLGTQLAKGFLEVNALGVET